MGPTNSGELAEHPHELLCIPHRLFFGLRDMDPHEVTAMFRARGVAGFLRDFLVVVPHLLGEIERRVQPQVRVAALRRERDRFGAAHARHEDARVRLLQRQDPRVDDAHVVVLAVPPEGARRSPCLDDEVVSLLEAIPVVSRVAVVDELLRPSAPDHPREDASTRHEVEHGDLFRELHRVVPERERISRLQDRHSLGCGNQRSRRDVAPCVHAVRAAVVLVHHDRVESDLFDQAVLDHPFAIETRRLFAVEVLVGEQHDRVASLARRVIVGSEMLRGLIRVGRHRLFGEVREKHVLPRLGA